eukprot:scaffold194567_cov18-Tisochrysis_lutea.AAC.1
MEFFNFDFIGNLLHGVEYLTEGTLSVPSPTRMCTQGAALAGRSGFFLSLKENLGGAEGTEKKSYGGRGKEKEKAA